MEPADLQTLLQGGGVAINGVAVVLLYKLHRDIAELANTTRHQWAWIKRLRRAVWPQTFAQDSAEGAE